MDELYQGQEPGQSSLAMDVFKQAVNPLNYYLYSPSAFSSKQGLKVPFKISKFKDNIKHLNKESGIYDYITGYSKATVRSFAPFEGDYLGGKNLERMRRVDPILATVKNKIRRLNAVSRGRKKKLTDVSDLFNSSNNNSATKEWRKAQPDIYTDGSKSYKGSEKNINRIKSHSSKLEHLERRKKRLLKASAAGSNIKKAMRLGKSLAIFNIMSLALDIGGAIGRPVGDSIVSLGDKLLGQMHDKFLPEMGKLSPGFLSSGSATERQRAIQAISRSHMNGRYAMGNEASLYHS